MWGNEKTVKIEKGLQRVIKVIVLFSSKSNFSEQQPLEYIKV